MKASDAEKLFSFKEGRAIINDIVRSLNKKTRKGTSTMEQPKDPNKSEHAEGDESTPFTGENPPTNGDQTKDDEPERRDEPEDPRRSRNGEFVHDNDAQVGGGGTQREGVVVHDYRDGTVQVAYFASSERVAVDSVSEGSASAPKDDDKK